MDSKKESSACDPCCRASVPLTAANLPDIELAQKEMSSTTNNPLPMYNREFGSFEGIICHIGAGAFHRSHQALYTHEVLLGQHEGESSERWAIVGVSLRTPTTRDALAPQDFLYSVLSRDAESTSVTVVGSLINIVLAGERDTMELVADPRTRILGLTITEKGYHCDMRTGNLNLTEPSIKHDLSNVDEASQSAVGFIVKALRMRMHRGLLPFTVQSCDNLPGNGKLAKGMVFQFLEALGEQDLLDWATAHCLFPGSMVDRITPATRARDPLVVDVYSDKVRSEICKSAGIKDDWPIICEQFKSWVIEDTFVCGRPDWDTKGAIFVADVAPFEQMKLRLLNASHSALAYIGYLLGHRYVHCAVENSLVRSFLKRFMVEQSHTVPSVPGIDLIEYQKTLLTRFENPFIKDSLLRLAEDGSQKLVTTLRDAALMNAQAGDGCQTFAIVVAAWARFLCGTDEEGDPIDVKDPNQKKLRIMATDIFGEVDNGGFVLASTPDRAAVLTLLSDVFGDELATNSVIADAVYHAVEKLANSSTRALVRAFLEL